MKLGRVQGDWKSKVWGGSKGLYEPYVRLERSKRFARTFDEAGRAQGDWIILQEAGGAQGDSTDNSLGGPKGTEMRLRGSERTPEEPERQLENPPPLQNDRFITYSY